jgi:hypothetical protein
MREKMVIEITPDRIEKMKKVAVAVVELIGASDLTVIEKYLCLKYLSETFTDTYKIEAEVFEVSTATDSKTAN